MEPTSRLQRGHTAFLQANTRPADSLDGSRLLSAALARLSLHQEKSRAEPKVATRAEFSVDSQLTQNILLSAEQSSTDSDT